MIACSGRKSLRVIGAARRVRHTLYFENMRRAVVVDDPLNECRYIKASVTC